MTSGQLLLLLGLLAGGVAALVLVERFIVQPVLVAAAVLGLAVVEAALVDIPLAVPLGPFNVFVADLLTAAVLAAAAARLLRTSPLHPAHLLPLGLLVVTVVSLVRGVGAFGIEAPVNEARAHLAYLSAIAYFSTVRPRGELLRRVGGAWVVAGAVLSALALLRWAAIPAGATTGVLASPGSPLRVLNSDHALVVAQAFAFVAPVAARRGTHPGIRLLATVFFAVTVALQHRTVWAALLVVSFLLVVRHRTLGRRLLAAAATVTVVASTAFVTFSAGEVIPRDEDIASAAVRTETFEWRVEGWRALVVEEAPDEVLSHVAGRPFGSGWQRSVDGLRVDVNPHNWFVEVYLRTGLLGLALFAALAVTATTALIRRRGRPPDDGLLFAFVAQLVSWLTYAPEFEQGLIAGLAVSAAVHRLGSGPQEPVRIGRPSVLTDSPSS